MQRRPKSFDMGHWIKKTRCGTVACLAGQILLTAGIDPISGHIGDQALEALGLPESQWWEARLALFFEAGWPESFVERSFAASNKQERVAVAIARVRHWLRTGE